MDEKWILKLLTHKTEQSNSITDIKTTEDIIIAPHQHRKINIRETIKENSEFETDINLRSKRKCHGYITKDPSTNTSYLNIYNASNSAKRIPQNTLLGYLHQTEKFKEDELPTTSNKNIYNNPQKQLALDKNNELLDISPHLTVEQHNKLAKMLKQFKHLFTSKTTDLEKANLQPVALELKPGNKPVSSPPYRQSQQERQKLNEILDELLQADILEECPNFTQYSSPAFLTKNRDSSYRLITDFRKINSMLKTDVTPIPSVNLVLNSLNNASLFTKIDLKGAYHQLEVAEQYRELLTIKTQDRLLRYKRLPMGLSVSTQLFTKAIQAVLNPHLYNKCINYIDDVIAYSKDFTTSLNNLKEILQVLDTANLKLNTKKCKFLYESTDILGHTVSKEGIKPQKSSVQAIVEFKTPTTIRQVRQFLGCSGFFRRFIKSYSSIAFPLTELIKNTNANLPFKWTTECQNAFQTIKEILTNPPLLAHFKDNWQTIIYCDSSLIGMGAVMLQQNPETLKLHPTYYLSKKYNDTQKRYSNVEREFLALTYSLNYLREYTIGRKVIVYTDCCALQHYKNFKSLNTRLNRLAISLVDYDIEVKHKPASANIVADSLSRNPIDQPLDEDLVDPCLTTQELIQIDMPLLQAQDTYLKQIRLAKLSPEAVPKKIRTASRNYTEIDDLLYYKKFDGHQTKLLLAIPATQQKNIIKLHHDTKHSGGHFSAYKTLSKINQKYYWPTMAKDTQNYTQTCPECQLYRPKTHKNYGKLMNQLPSTKPLDRIILDFLGPIHNSHGYHYVLVATDSCTRYAFATPCRNIDAKTVADKLLDLSYTYGFPNTITHDRGTHFMNNVLKEFTRSLGIQQRPSAAYVPQVQGLTEKFNHTLIKSIATFTKDYPQQWAKYIAPVTFCYNTTKNVSTNYTPFYLLHGFEANTPADLIFYPQHMDNNILQNIKILQETRNRMPQILEKAQKRQKDAFDKTKQDLKLQIGDEVLIKYPKDHTQKYSKFIPLFKGPFTVKSKINDLTYGIEIYRYGKLVEEPIHVSRIKLFHRRI